MDLIKTYNPGATLNDEEQAAMRNLTDGEIEQLAKAYPNQPTGNAYLVYYMKDEKENEQRYPLGTWQNLHNLRKLGRKNILPYAFRKGFQARTQPATIAAPAQRVVDLSKQEVEEAEGLKPPVVDQEPVVDQTPAPAPKAAELITNPELEAAQKELQQAIDDKAHPMVIKGLQVKVDELKAVPVTIPASQPIDLNAL